MELGHQVNEKRWALVLETIDGSERSLAQLKTGVAKLREGAGATQLSDGFEKMGGAIRTMDARMPYPADLKALKAGAQQLHAGQREFGGALDQLQAGAVKLGAGARQMEEKMADIPFVDERISKAAGGGEKLAEGLGKAGEGNGRLQKGGGAAQGRRI
ncbi:MAG: hypothetical protein MO853_01975 [Candidatus Protistobacter heckmanni]|nr:hypothetical protein [Candidatus Protistobacter heckmanni]